MVQRFLAGVVLLLLWATGAVAHPHVWADIRSGLIVNADGKITGVRNEWTFDEGYTGFALDGLDTDHDGVYGPDEIRPLTEENIKNLLESAYFTVIRQNGHVLLQGEVKEYGQTYEGGRLTLYFVLPLKTPADPKAGPFDYKIYDPDFFIDFAYKKDDPVELEGNLPAGCKFELKPVPSDDEIAEKRDFLANKDINWQNDTGEDFGSIFAQAAVVECENAAAAPAAATTVKDETQIAETAAPKIDPRKLLVPPKNPDGSFQVTPFTEDPVRWMRDHQQNFYRQMRSSLTAMNAASPLTAGWTLILLSFIYGVFHAAGPGHGKAVISAWLLATESELKRGILVAGLSAFFQSLTAIVVVSALLLFVHGAAAMARDVAGFLESAGYLMIAGLGLYLIWGAFPGRRVARQAVSPALATAGAPGSQHMMQEHHFEITNPRLASLPADHVHGPDCGCGHAHAPSAAEVRGDDWSLWRGVTMAFAVGLRPCSGALLVLIAAWGMGLYWAGVVSTLAMGLGVFITISVIAALTIYGRSLALRYASLNGRSLSLTVKGLRIACGLGIALLGGLMFWASLGSSNVML